jgi:methionyl-tRNA formyltransferase
VSGERVLFLGPADSPILAHLREHVEHVTATEAPPSTLDVSDAPPGFVVSHGYRYILPPAFLTAFPRSAINCHISYLPWNRGADPNLWSWLEGTPRGVTVHYMDPGVDTGDVIARRAVDFGPSFDDETLATSYRRLQAELAGLFAETWPSIRARQCTPSAQQGRGSYHRSVDKELFVHLLTNGWETPVARLVYPKSRFAPLAARREG